MLLSNFEDHIPSMVNTTRKLTHVYRKCPKGWTIEHG
jgi:hypothetical protein